MNQACTHYAAQCQVMAAFRIPCDFVNRPIAKLERSVPKINETQLISLSRLEILILVNGILPMSDPQ